MERRRNADLLIPFASFFEENTAVCPAHCAPLVASSLAVWFVTAVREDDDMPWCIYHARRLKHSWLRRRTCRWGSKIQFSKAKMTEATATDAGLIWQNCYCRLLPCQCLCHHMLYDYSARMQSLEAFLQRHQDSSSASVQAWLHMLDMFGGYFVTAHHGNLVSWRQVAGSGMSLSGARRGVGVAQLPSCSPASLMNPRHQLEVVKVRSLSPSWTSLTPQKQQEQRGNWVASRLYCRLLYRCDDGVVVCLSMSSFCLQDRRPMVPWNVIG